ncbi:MAG: Stp1/IreP family PP2C-type Ser/Thr phosphatase [Firmicutes bacterium]|nr:Stp1/IreP family PP2C-type Ser/Thr phosphatase [Bacillota bacterium]
MRIVSKTDIGKVRRSNQDSYSSGELPGGVAWAVVCDGMGGANGGNVASATAVKVISEHISSSYREGMGSNSVRMMLESAISAANISVFDMAQSVDTLAGMGTTVVSVVILDNIAHIAHAGDSRAYLITGDSIEQITRDHSVVQSLVENGTLTTDEAKVYPGKNVITRALGVDERIIVDYNEVPLEKHDSILICTDGLTNYLDNEDILSVTKNNNFYEYPDKLIKLANTNGGGDNITVVIMSL